MPCIVQNSVQVRQFICTVPEIDKDARAHERACLLKIASQAGNCGRVPCSRADLTSHLSTSPISSQELFLSD